MGAAEEACRGVQRHAWKDTLAVSFDPFAEEKVNHDQLFLI